MHPYRLTVLTGVGFATLAMLLPFLSLPVAGSVDGLSADAWPALVPLLPVALLVIDQRSEHGLAGLTAAIGAGLAGTAMIFATVKLADAIVAARSPGATLGAGVWVLTASVAAVLVGLAYGVFVRR